MEGDLDLVTAYFPEKISPHFLSQIHSDDPLDPIGLQFFANHQESLWQDFELSDPTEDEGFSKLEGLVHRYPDRVLLKPIVICPMHCRFCFRKDQLSGKEGKEGLVLHPKKLAQALDYIKNNTQIFEVILTGGDPLLLSDRKLMQLMQAIASIDHVALIRIHTRMVLGVPDRITPGLIQALSCGKPVFIAIHVNHSNEFTPQGCEACALLSNAGIMLLSQSVLLNQVNDSVESLEALFRSCIRNRIKPYYLHHLDPVVGSAHFAVSLEKGKALMRCLRGRLTGLAQPLYVTEQPKGRGKIPVEWI
jgi:lysine 2,3-aminomutase